MYLNNDCELRLCCVKAVLKRIHPCDLDEVPALSEQIYNFIIAGTVDSKELPRGLEEQREETAPKEAGTPPHCQHHRHL